MPIIKCLSDPRIDSYSIYLHTIHGKYSRYLSLFDSLSSVVFCIPHAAECKIKTCFLDSARCRSQKQNLYSILRSVQSPNRSLFSGSARCGMQKQNLFLWSAHCIAQKQTPILDSARCGVAIQNLFSTLCTLRDAKSVFVFASRSTMNHSHLGNFTILLSVR